MTSYKCVDCPLAFVSALQRERHELEFEHGAHGSDAAARFQADLDAAIARADSYLDLIHQAISHHIEAHPECGHYRTDQS